MLVRVLPFMEGPAGGDMAQAAAALPSLARCAALRNLTVLVYSSPGRPAFGGQRRACWCDLRCPHLFDTRRTPTRSPPSPRRP